MTIDQGEQTELLMVRDEAGHVYAFPRAVADQHRLTDEAVTELRNKAAGEDVSGFNQPSGGSGPTATSFGGGVRGQNLSRIAAHLDPVAQEAFVFWISMIGAHPLQHMRMGP